MKKLNVLALAAAGVLGIMIASGSGCADDTSTADAGTTVTDAGNKADAGGGTDAGGGDAGMPECYDNPKTHFEIINACTNAQKIEKTVDVSDKLLPDGGLPPAP